MPRSPISFNSPSAYLRFALSTEASQNPNVSMDSQLYRLAHSACGLTTEAIELMAMTDIINLREELGDVLWYAALGFVALCMHDGRAPVPLFLAAIDHREDYDIDLASNLKGLDKAMLVHVGAIMDAVQKRPIFYNKPRPDYLATFEAHLTAVVGYCAMICELHNLSFLSVLVGNVNKLDERYGGAFDALMMENRDLGAERAAVASA